MKIKLSEASLRALKAADGDPLVAQLLAGIDATKRPTFTCPKCAMVSYHPKDIEYGYCGNCHDFTGDGSLLKELDRCRQILKANGLDGIRGQASLPVEQGPGKGFI